jgi:hypothetical protein
MTLVRLLPVVISCLLLAAHFSRADNAVLVLISIAFPAILLLRRPWVVWTVQLALVLGGLEWIRRTVELVLQREAAGEPWTRLALILDGVALFTAGSALGFVSPALRQRYGIGAHGQPGGLSR